MFNREDLPGILLLGLCAVVAIALLIEIFTGYSFEYNGPGWLATAISLVGFGLIIFMSWRAWGSRIKRWRGDHGGGAQWPQNDVRGERTWPRRSREDGAVEPPPASNLTDPADQPDRTDQRPR